MLSIEKKLIRRINLILFQQIKRNEKREEREDHAIILIFLFTETVYYYLVFELSGFRNYGQY